MRTCQLMPGNGEVRREETFRGDKYVNYYDCDKDLIGVFFCVKLNFECMQLTIHKFYFIKSTKDPKQNIDELLFFT